MRIVCQQTILMKYQTLFFSKIRKDVRNFFICCSCDWRFKGLSKATSSLSSSGVTLDDKKIYDYIIQNE